MKLMGNQEGGDVLKENVIKAYEKAEEKFSKGNILKTFEIIEKWRNSGKYCCINIKSDYNYCWRIEILEHLSERHEPAYIVDGFEDLYEAVLEMDKQLKNT